MLPGMSIHPDDLTDSLFEALSHGANQIARAQLAQIRAQLDDHAIVALDCAEMGGSWLGNN